ncbi:MAG: helix-hairpin-helix domain-containing protein [bacterium]|nr:helix-hairpin-helix domain-containing protein [bacterium]
MKGSVGKRARLPERAGISKVPKNVIVAAAIVAVLVAGLALAHWWPSSGGISIVSSEESASSVGEGGDAAAPKSEQKIIYVHVVGAVKKPGVYTFAQGVRAEAAVDAAGGFAKNANTASVNLAHELVDGEQIYIPTKDEAGSAQGTSGSASLSKVNINTASTEELETLPGIGPAIAGEIISYRQLNGRFDSIEDIRNVSGIGDGRFSKIKALICV